MLSASGQQRYPAHNALFSMRSVLNVDCPAWILSDDDLIRHISHDRGQQAVHAPNGTHAHLEDSMSSTRSWTTLGVSCVGAYALPLVDVFAPL